MKSRKALFAEKRKQKAKELKAFNRDQFIRKLLRRKGIPVCFQFPEQECFRGFQVYVDQIIPVSNCGVGVVLGCEACRHSVSGFEQIARGQTQNLAFKCRAWDSKPKFWIIHPTQKVPGPGVYRVERTKPIYDSHGHLLEQATTQTGPPLPRIMPSPAASPGAGFIADTFLFSLSTPIPGAWRTDPQLYMPNLLALALTNNMDPGLQQVLSNAFAQQRLTVQFVPGGLQFSIGG